MHAAGETFAEVTEYLWPFGFWERCRYEWPSPDHVRATVLDSNVLGPGSTWDLTVVPVDGRTRVETVLRRTFANGLRGRVAKTLNHTMARVFMPKDLRRALRQIERQAS